MKTMPPICRCSSVRFLKVAQVFRSFLQFTFIGRSLGFQMIASLSVFSKQPQLRAFWVRDVT